ncbi:TolC family protein [Cytophagaceae bacterium DM2B3-1]|uniref:TolC family protein n=1 Tax=Xanthocytophaga flava TaxID=3048013 RepID=A0ABT7CGY9_9BACT|nr:TolC family protein [Xanthocytophaga flavus]MDJ1493001.1 TolC family protein [Xanthocytophaga flavus]
MNYLTYHALLRNTILHTTIICLLLTFKSESVKGQTSTNVITLPHLLSKARASYPAMAIQSARTQASQAYIKQIKANQLPTLRLQEELTLGTANSRQGSYFSPGVNVSTSGRNQTEATNELATGNIAVAFAEWKLFNFGGFQAEQTVAKAEWQGAVASLQKEEFLLQKAVIEAYLNLLKYQRLALIEQQNMARAQKISQVIENLVRTGLKPSLDSSLAIAELTKANLNYLRLQEQYQQSYLYLSMLCGLTPNSWQADTTLNTSRLQNISTTGVLPADHPSLLPYQRNIDLQLARNTFLQKEIMPKFSLLGAVWMRGSSITTESTFGPLANGLGFQRQNFLLGAVASFDLIDIERMHRKRSVQQYRLEQARQELTLSRMQLENELMTTDASLAALQEQLNQIPRLIRAGQDVYNQRLNLYNNGLETIVGLTSSLQMVYQTEKEYEELRDRTTRQVLRKALATNDIDSFLRLFQP